MHPGPAHHVVGLLTGLGDAAADDLVDELRVDAGALEHLHLCGAEQLGRVQTREPSPALALRRTHCFDDDWLAHGCLTGVRLTDVTESRTRSPRRQVDRKSNSLNSSH